MSLKQYNQKRNFKNTFEPKGKKNTKNKKRFVIQYHEATSNHYDFRLEYNGVLLSWAIPKGLSCNPKDKRLAVKVEDHPVDYINFQGIIPKGNYGAGTVEIFDKGNYVELESFKNGLKNGSLKFVLNGEKFKGAYSLVRTQNNNWLIIKSNDAYANQKTYTHKKNTKLPFVDVNVQLATLTQTIPQGKDWIFEIKYDGYRILSFIQDGKVKMLSRNKQDYTNKFRDLEKSLKKIKKNCILDGEVVVFNKDGKSDFGVLQQNIKNNSNNFSYVVFDILAQENIDLRDKPLNERKQILENILVKAPSNIIYSTYVLNKGKQCFALAKKLKLEGIVAKNLKSSYSGKRNEDWLKIKCYKRQEFVICGYTTTPKNKYLSAIIVGYYKNNNLIYVGKVGTGFCEQQKKDLYLKFKKITQQQSPLLKTPKIPNAIWISPVLVAEIKYTELTKDKILRQPSFISLRHDKCAQNVTLEENND